MDPKTKLLCAFYALVALVALLGTWSQNLAFMALPDNGGVLGFIRASSANPAAASIGIDLGCMCLAAFVWMIVEARRVGVRLVGVYIVLSCLIAVSVMFPLFLLARELRLAAAKAPTPA